VVSAPVTQLADAVTCPRRYQLLHELRLEEHPDREPALPDPLGPEPGGSPAALGTLAHRLLEIAPLRLDPAARRAELTRLLALEGSELVERALPVKSGIVFLRTKGAPFVERTPQEAGVIRARLLAAAGAIADGRRTGSWPRVEPARCRSIGCGFVRRCHPEER